MDYSIRGGEKMKCDDKCKYYEEDEGCLFFSMGSGNSLDMPCRRDATTELLDKIRAEIQENINYNKKMNYQGIVAGLLLTLNIIDKYKAEELRKDGETA